MLFWKELCSGVEIGLRAFLIFRPGPFPGYQFLKSKFLDSISHLSLGKTVKGQENKIVLRKTGRLKCQRQSWLIQKKENLRFI